MEESWKQIYEERAANPANPDYAASYWSKEGFQELIKITSQILSKENTNQTVLDVGCGPGNYCKLLSESGFKVTGIDYSQEMINRAKLNAPKAKLLIGDGYNLGFNNKSFDIVLSIGVLTCVSEYKKFVEEMKRVAKKTIIISTLLRNRKVEDVQEFIKRKLKNDPWPTIDYHPSELLELFDEEEYDVEIITHHDTNEIISDGFFLIARKR